MNLTVQLKNCGSLNFCYREGTTDEHAVAQHLKNSNVLFIPEYTLKPDDVIIDIGAHIGTFSIPAAAMLKSGKVYAIEAGKENCECIEKNRKLNNLTNVFISHLALTDFKGKTKLYHKSKKGYLGSSIVKDFSGEAEEVPADTLANFMQDNHILHCDYMKLNCEGAEFNIILSTPMEILQRVDLMLILYHLDIAKNFSTEGGLIQHLQQSGFSTKVRHRNQKLGRGMIIASNRNCQQPLLQTMHLKMKIGQYFFSRKLGTLQQILLRKILKRELQ